MPIPWLTVLTLPLTALHHPCYIYRGTTSSSDLQLKKPAEEGAWQPCSVSFPIHGTGVTYVTQAVPFIGLLSVADAMGM